MFLLNRAIHYSTLGCFIGMLVLVTCPARALILSEMSLEVSGRWLSTSYGGSNLGLLLQLNVPLDPQRPVPAQGSLLQDEQTTPADDVPLDPLERDSPDAPEGDARDPAWEGAIARRASVVEPLDVTPDFVAALTAAALVAQGCDAAFARLESLGTRNRVSALLPEVSLRAGREQDTALRLTPTDTDPFRYAQSDSSNLLLEGRVAWRLGRLLFSSEDLGIERLRLARSRERQRVVERTLAVFFQWLRAQSELARTRVPRRATRMARWEVIQTMLHLDAMTGGWFSAHSAEIGRHRVTAEESRPEAAPGALEGAGKPPAPAPVPQQHKENKPNTTR